MYWQEILYLFILRMSTVSFVFSVFDRNTFYKAINLKIVGRSDSKMTILRRCLPNDRLWALPISSGTQSSYEWYKHVRFKLFHEPRFLAIPNRPFFAVIPKCCARILVRSFQQPQLVHYVTLKRAGGYRCCSPALVSLAVASKVTFVVR